MTITKFQRITRTVKRQGHCSVCGKAVTRTGTFGQTVNPFNRNDDGSPKSAREVDQAVAAQAAAWRPAADDFIHAKCVPAVPLLGVPGEGTK